VRLTEAGKIYYERVKNVLAELGEARNAIVELQSVPSGLLRIDAREALGRRLIAPILKEFCVRYPRIRISLRLSDRAADKLSDGVDIVLRYGKGEQGDVYSRKILATQRILVANPALLQGKDPPRRPSDLSFYPCIAYTGGGAPAIWRFRKGQEVEEANFVAVLEVNDTDALVTAAQSGLGIALVHDWVVREELAKQSLVRIFADYDVSTLQDFDAPIYLIHDKKAKSAKITAFVEFLSKVYDVDAAGALPATKPPARRKNLEKA
jgi:DNA-binding transcriptional LysR family regulator